jgi:uncharacterized membrane protein
MASEYPGQQTRAQDWSRAQGATPFDDEDALREQAYRNQMTPPHRTRAYRTATGLGWFSIGLGVAELVAPHAVARMAGIPDRPWLTRLCGLREIASGLGILNRPAQRSTFLWSRVAGDAMDLALLGSALASPRNPRRDQTLLATAAVAGVTLLDVMTAREYSRSEGGYAASSHVVPLETSLAVNRSPEECYRFWRDFSNLPRFMTNIESVQATDDKHSHWVGKLPVGGTTEWDSELTSDIPNSLIAWRSIGTKFAHVGTVRFEPEMRGRGTIVRLRMQYEPPGGTLGTMAMKMVAGFKKGAARENLRRFKQLLETGEIPTTEGQSSGRRNILTRPFRPRTDSEMLRSQPYES